MISEYLDHEYVTDQIKAQRKSLKKTRKLAREGDEKTLELLKKENITLDQLDTVIDALKAAQKLAKDEPKKETHGAFIPRDPVSCSLQAGLTEIAFEKGLVKETPPASNTRGLSAGAEDTSATYKLEIPPQTRAAFVEGDDAHYAVDGFFAKFGALFKKRHDFNENPAKPVTSSKPLQLYVFGDWGTGLSLAQSVTRQIGYKMKSDGETHQQHVIHLGDIYYVGDGKEYIQRAFPFWPVAPEQSDSIGSWSLNGNHDMYEGGYGYFDTMLTEDRFIKWHADADGKPSSFFLIEDDHWQVFGLDTSWNTPSLSSAIFSKPTVKDYGGMNGFIDESQANFMKEHRNTDKGCILLTHHQPAGSRKKEKQDSKQVVKLLSEAGVYDTIDAWLWGHEHRAVVFKPKADRKDDRLINAPEFCSCLGHGGVPVTDENFDAEGTIDDVLWQDDGSDTVRPIYEGDPIMPFGFAKIDTRPGSFDFTVFDHDGQVRYNTEFKK